MSSNGDSRTICRAALSMFSSITITGILTTKACPAVLQIVFCTGNMKMLERCAATGLHPPLHQYMYIQHIYSAYIPVIPLPRFWAARCSVMNKHPDLNELDIYKHCRCLCCVHSSFTLGQWDCVHYTIMHFCPSAFQWLMIVLPQASEKCRLKRLRKARHWYHVLCTWNVITAEKKKILGAGC